MFGYNQVFLTHGLLGGVACGVMYIPSMCPQASVQGDISHPTGLGIPSHYFHRKRALTMGIVSAGVRAPDFINSMFYMEPL